jgi:hypothetical protein
MATLFINIIDKETESHRGILRIIKFDDGTSKADYFAGAGIGTTEFDNKLPTVSGEFTENESFLKISNLMLDILPENKIYKG